MNEPRAFLASVFDSGLRDPIFAKCPGLFWQPQDIQRPCRTIEDLCRDLIRKSEVFVCVLDSRSGRALAFADVLTPVTVLEIELVQAIFERIPITIFALPGFKSNARLRGLVKFSGRFRLARVDHTACARPEASGLSPEAVSSICHVAERSWINLARERWAGIAERFRRHDRLNVQFLDGGFDAFRDPFEARETMRLIEAAASQQDHATRLAMLWAAVRQLCSVPYTDDAFNSVRPLWERTLSEWVRSAAWYGLHGDSPISQLSAVNSLIWIRERIPGQRLPATSPLDFQGTRGARASALYSIARRCWRPGHRWHLLTQALRDLELAMNACDGQLGGYLAIRGSVYRMRGQLRRAVRDHERMVELRTAQPAEKSALGEALTELGWTYAWVGRLRKSKRYLSQGVALLCEEAVTNPIQAAFRIRALRKLGAVQVLTFDLTGSRHSVAEAQRLARQYLVTDQMRIV